MSTEKDGQGSLFGGAPAAVESTDDTIRAAYVSTGRTLDDLPYTAEFDSIHRAAGGASYGTPRQLFHRLHNLRKAGKLGRVGAAATKPPKISEDDERLLRGLVEGAVGSLGQRDQLPFTPQMDRLVEDFNTRTGRTLDPHTVWRLIAKLAK
jgi:hypothetical protein